MNDPAAASALDAPLLAPIATASADERPVDGVRLGDGTQPAWQRDALSVSSRVRAILAALQPIAVRVLTFWDHAVRSVRIGAARLEVDPSGSYRLRP